MNSDQPKKRILVVDDEAYVLELISLALSGEGFEVLRAMNGEEGLKLAGSKKPDAIVLDVNLPDISGIEVCQRLKTQKDTQQIPILLLSAMVQKQKIEQGIAAGAAAYIAKPFQMKSFVQQVLRVLEKR